MYFFSLEYSLYLNYKFNLTLSTLWSWLHSKWWSIIRISGVLDICHNFLVLGWMGPLKKFRFKLVFHLMTTCRHTLIPRPLEAFHQKVAQKHSPRVMLKQLDSLFLNNFGKIDSWLRAPPSSPTIIISIETLNSTSNY